MSALTVAVRRLPHGRGQDLPDYATAESAGMDLLAAVEADLVLTPGARALVPTGIAIALPPGTEAQGGRVIPVSFQVHAGLPQVAVRK